MNIIIMKIFRIYEEIEKLRKELKFYILNT